MRTGGVAAVTAVDATVSAGAFSSATTASSAVLIGTSSSLCPSLHAPLCAALRIELEGQQSQRACSAGKPAEH